MLESYLWFLNEGKIPPRAFHISNNAIKILQPKIPDNMYTKMGWEDKTIKRISVAPDIDHCILAIGNNKIKERPKIYRVYEPQDYSKVRFLSNKEIVKRKLVPDAKVMKEFWILNAVRVKEIAKIRILRELSKYVTVPIGPQGYDTPRKNRRQPFWEWEVIEGEI